MVQKKKEVNWEDFNKIDCRVGTIIKAENFRQAKKPAYILYVDLGEGLGTCKSSAQITENYTIDELIGKQVLCIVNFTPKQIGPIMSEVLVTGFPDTHGNVVLCVPDKKAPNGAILY